MVGTALAAQVAGGVDWGLVDVNFVMQVRSSSPSGRAHRPDHLTSWPTTTNILLRWPYLVVMPYP